MIVFRDFIYLDIDRVQSILAQLQQGLLNEMLEGKTEQTTGRAQIALNLLYMMLPIRASGSVEQSRGTSISESKVLHDYAFEQARLTLEGEGLLTERDDLERDEVPEDGFVLVRGAAEILDYETLRQIAINFDKIDDFFHSEDSQTQRKNRHKENKSFRESKELLETFFKDAIRVRITNAQGCRFIGPLTRNHLRENIRDLIYKHGSNPKGDWLMLAEISRIPAPGQTEESMDVLEEASESSAVSGNLDSIARALNKFQDFLGSAAYPDVVVSPIAVYREINSYPET